MTIQTQNVSEFWPEFWKEGCAATTRHAVFLLHMAGKDVTGQNLMALIHSAPRSEAEVADAEKRKSSFCRNCLDIAYTRLADAEQAPHPDYDAADFHFLVTLPAMAAGTRKLLEDSVVGVITGLGLQNARLDKCEAK